MARRGDPGQRQEISAAEARGVPEEDLRDAQGAPETGVSESAEQTQQGRVASAIQGAARRIRQRKAKQRAKEQRAELEDQRDGDGLLTRIFGDDAAEEVSAMLDETGGMPSREEFNGRLDLDHDGDGQDLASELGLDALDAGESRPKQPASSDQIQRDLQAMGQIGRGNGQTRGFDQQLDDDLDALSAVGEEADTNVREF